MGHIAHQALCFVIMPKTIEINVVNKHIPTKNYGLVGGRAKQAS